LCSGVPRSLRRKPPVNHCAKYENSTVDFGTDELVAGEQILEVLNAGVGAG
jgi:hypothetical protein